MPEAPLCPELVLTTTDASALDNAKRVVALLLERGFLAPPGRS